MKIEKLEMTNFQNHEATTIEFGKTNLIIGANGHGKTGIINSICLGISGVLPTKPYAEYIRNGTTETSIQLTTKIDGRSTQTRKTISSDSKIKTTLMATNALLQAIGTTPEMARTLIDTWYFVEGADGKTRRNILSSILVPRLDAKTLEAAISDHVNDQFRGAHSRFIESNYNSLDSPKKTQMDMLYKLAYDKRRDKKAELKKIETDITELGAKLSAYTKSEGEIDVATIERTKLHVEITTDLAHAGKCLQDATEELNNYSTKITELKGTLSELKSTVERTVTQEEVDGITSKIDVLHSQVRGMNTAVKALKNIDESDKGPRCPYFKEGCKYPDVLNDIDEAIKHTESEIKSKTTEVGTLEATKQKEDEQLKLCNKISEMEEMLSMADQKVCQMGDTIKTKEEEIKGKNIRLEALIKKGIVTDEGLSEMANHKEHAKLAARLEVWKEDKETAKEDVEFLEEAVTIYNNQDVWKALLSGKKDEFSQKLKETISLLIPKYEPLVSENLELSFSGISINTLSKSERFRVGVAVQTALAITSGIGIVIADGSDIVTNPTEFIDLINQLGAIDEVETVIVASSIDFTNPKVLRAHNIESEITTPTKKFTIIEGKVTDEGDISGALAWE